MSISQDPIFETALSLPQSQRADLAFQLLQSLDPLGEEVSSEEFSAELLGRIEEYHRGEGKSFSLDETRVLIEERLREGRPR